MCHVPEMLQYLIGNLHCVVSLYNVTSFFFSNYSQAGLKDRLAYVATSRKRSGALVQWS